MYKKTDSRLRQCNLQEKELITCRGGDQIAPSIDFKGYLISFSLGALLVFAAKDLLNK